jgi:hypothetical protein
VCDSYEVIMSVKLPSPSNTTTTHTSTSSDIRINLPKNKDLLLAQILQVVPLLLRIIVHSCVLANSVRKHRVSCNTVRLVSDSARIAEREGPVVCRLGEGFPETGFGQYRKRGDCINTDFTAIMRLYACGAMPKASCALVAADSDVKSAKVRFKISARVVSSFLTHVSQRSGLEVLVRCTSRDRELGMTFAKLHAVQLRSLGSHEACVRRALVSRLCSHSETFATGLW